LKKPILIAAALFALLFLFYLIFEGDAPEQNTAYQGVRFLPLKAAEVRELKINTREGLTFHCVKDTDNSWNVIAGERKAKASEKINDFLDSFTSLPQIDRIPLNANRLDQYGLHKPSSKVILTDLTNKTYEILIGDNTPITTTGVYVMLTDNNEVIILGAALNWELSKISSLFTFLENQKE
jgi:hypothetical protein